MIRKDFIEAEIQKLAQVIAKIIGLKNEGNLDDAIELSQQALLESFGFDIKFLEGASVEDFSAELKSRNFSPEKLNALVQVLFESSYPFQETEACRAIMHKVSAVLNFLETEHRQQSLENLSRREMIDKFLNNNQYE